VNPSSIEQIQKNPLLESIEISKKLPPPALASLPFAHDRLEESSKKSDSLSQVEKPSRPKLPPPCEKTEKTSPLTKLLHLQIEGEKVHDELMSLDADELKETIHRYEKNTLEQMKKQKELFDKQTLASTWGTYRQIVSTLASASTFFAASAVSGGGAATAHLTWSLLVAGSSALFNQGMTLSGGWEKFANLFSSNEETKANIASLLEKSVTVGSTLLGLISLGVFSTSVQLHNPSFWTQPLSADNAASRISSALTTLINVGSLFLGIKTGIDTSKNYELQKEVKISEDLSMAYKYRTNQISKTIQESSDNQFQLNETCNEAVQHAVASFQLAAQSA
jgi:hypothetical protein